MDKQPFLVILFLSLILSFVPIRVQGQETISGGVVVSGSVSEGETRLYYLSENLSKDSFVILSVKRVSGSGKFALQKDSLQVGEYSVYSYSGPSSPLRFDFYPFALPENGTGYAFNVSGFYGESFEFWFFYDIADVLSSRNSKIIPFEAGAVGYYVDMNRGDRLSLNLNLSEDDAEFDIFVAPSLFAGYPSFGVPSVASTFFAPSPKSTEFITDYKARFLVFVVSTRGSGNFTLSSFHTGNPVEGALENLRNRVDYLNNLVDNLILICIASFFVAAISAGMYSKLRRSLQQSLGTRAK